MARNAKKGADRSSLVISIVVHALALGGLAYLAHKAGFVPSAVYKITGIKPPEKPKPKPKPPEPPADVPPPKAADIVEETTPPPNAQPQSAAPPTASVARSDAPPAAGGGAGNFFQAQARKPDAAPVRGIQGKPGTGAGNLESGKSTAAATASRSAFDEASTKPSTVATVLEERKNAAAAQEAVSAEQITRTGGGDASQITTRITGVVATENKQIVVRGLNDRYNVATLNGAELPSADPRRRAPQLDLIPGAMIDRVVVSKTFTPDLQGGFAGGAVNIVTKSFPAKAFTSVSLGAGINTESTFNGGFLNSPGGSLDWLAMDDGTRELPQGALIDFNNLVRDAERPWRVNTEQAVGAQRLEAAQRIESAMKSFGNTTFAPFAGAPGPNSTFTLSAGDTTWLLGRRFGWFGTVTHDRKFQFYDDAFRGRYAYGQDSNDGGPLTRTSEFRRDQATAEVSWGAVASGAIELMPGHELSASFLHNQSAQQINIEENGKTLDQFDPGSTARSRIYQISYRERFLRNSQFKGRHEFRELAGAQLDWAVSLSSTAEDSPDERIFPLIYEDDGSGGYNIIAQSAELPNINQPARFFRKSEDSSRNYRADLTIPFTPGNGLESSVKFGVNSLESERTLRQSLFEYAVPQNTGSGQADIASYANSVLQFDGSLFTTNFTGSGANRRAAYVFPRDRAGFLRGGLPFDGYGYDGRQTIPAVYGMTDLYAASWLRLVGGARIEKTDLSAQVLPRSGIIGSATSGNIETTDVLPSLSAVFPITKELNLRVGWSETVARPTYREFAPFEYYDTTDGLAYRGNASLRRTSIENYDARLEWFPRPGELLSAAYFRKKLSDPIEPFIADNANGIVSFTNNPVALVQGVEFEARKNLGALDPLLTPFTLGGNFSYIDSVVDVYYPSGTGIALYRRPLFDQPEYILNGDLTWESVRLGTSVTLNYARSGQRLAVDGGQGSPNIYEQPVDTLDLYVNQRFGRWKMRFGARNLLDPDVRQILINDLGNTPERYGDAYVFRSYRRGITYTLTISTEF